MSKTGVNVSVIAGKSVCLVTSGNVGSNPRLVKEADALVAAGAQVHVVAVKMTRLPEVQARDRFILDRNVWPCTLVEAGGLVARALRGIGQRAAMLVFVAGIRSDRIACLAHSRMIGRLGRAASAIPADLYIAHNLAALPAAQHAAARNGAKLGFDAEDFHSGQFAQTDESSTLPELTRQIERHYLPCCAYITAASPGIGRAYAAAYGLQQPTTILNVFPTNDAPVSPTQRGSALHSPSLYWFSQTIGPDRGLEAVLGAIASSHSRPCLHLQGTIAQGYETQLKMLANTLGIADRLAIVKPALPSELPSLAAQFDAGLATEPADTVNRDVCLSNKVFTYLLAGIPVLATDTTGQLELSREVPGVMQILPLADPKQWAGAIDALLLDAPRLAAARKAAWHAAQERFNWDIEQHAFLQAVGQALDQTERGMRR